MTWPTRVSDGLRSAISSVEEAEREIHKCWNTPVEPVDQGKILSAVLCAQQNLLDVLGELAENGLDVVPPYHHGRKT